MSHTPHELAEEFPDHVTKIAELKSNDPHFSKLAETYHDVNRAIHRAETDVEPTDDAHMQQMRRERSSLKDQIWGAIRG
jgi:uncharacterized protein YdcH (DUF465 family)